ncbi:MAG: DUF7000 family protein [Christensenellales bacterium]
MGSLNDHVKEYTIQLSKGHIQKAYKGIMTFMSDLRAYLEREHPNYSASALYFGYMDMTYFAFTPPALKNMKLKIAIVFLHEECRFELWLAGNNRQIQAEYLEMLSHKNISPYTLSQIHPGVDSIIESILHEQPDFNHPDELKKQIEMKTIEFANDITSMLK